MIKNFTDYYKVVNLLTCRILDNPSLFQPVPESSRTHWSTRPRSTRPSLFVNLTFYFTCPRRGSNLQPLYHEPFSIPPHQRFNRQSTTRCSINTGDCIDLGSDGAIATLHAVVMQQRHLFIAESTEICGRIMERWRYLFNTINYGINYGIRPIINYYSLLGRFSFFSHLYNATHLGRSIHYGSCRARRCRFLALDGHCILGTG